MYYCENHDYCHYFEEAQLNICQNNYFIKRNNINYEISKHIRNWNEKNREMIMKQSDSSHYNEYIKENNQELYNEIIYAITHVFTNDYYLCNYHNKIHYFNDPNTKACELIVLEINKKSASMSDSEAAFEAHKAAKAFTKVCKKCNTIKPLDDFYSYRNSCKECFITGSKQRGKMFYCEMCDKNILVSNKSMHFKTKKHQINNYQPDYNNYQPNYNYQSYYYCQPDFNNYQPNNNYSFSNYSPYSYPYPYSPYSYP